MADTTIEILLTVVLEMKFVQEPDLAALERMERALHDLWLLLWQKKEEYPELFEETEDTPTMAKARAEAWAILDKYYLSGMGPEEYHKQPEFSAALEKWEANSVHYADGTLVSTMAHAAAFVSNLRRCGEAGISYYKDNLERAGSELAEFKRRIRRYV